MIIFVVHRLWSREPAYNRLTLSKGVHFSDQSFGTWENYWTFEKPIKAPLPLAKEILTIGVIPFAMEVAAFLAKNIK